MIPHLITKLSRKKTLDKLRNRSIIIIIEVLNYGKVKTY